MSALRTTDGDGGGGGSAYGVLCIVCFWRPAPGALGKATALRQSHAVYVGIALVGAVVSGIEVVTQAVGVCYAVGGLLFLVAIARREVPGLAAA